MSATEQEYKNHIKELEQQVRLLKEQVDFLTHKLYGTKSEKTSTLEIEGQMSLFNEIETCADPDAHEPELVEIEKHLRKRKYTGQREELVKNLPHSKVLHTIDEREQICDNCGSTMVKVGETYAFPPCSTAVLVKLTKIPQDRRLTIHARLIRLFPRVYCILSLGIQQ